MEVKREGESAWNPPIERTKFSFSECFVWFLFSLWSKCFTGIVNIFVDAQMRSTAFQNVKCVLVPYMMTNEGPNDTLRCTSWANRMTMRHIENENSNDDNSVPFWEGKKKIHRNQTHTQTHTNTNVIRLYTIGKYNAYEYVILILPDLKHSNSAEFCMGDDGIVIAIVINDDDGNGDAFSIQVYLFYWF